MITNMFLTRKIIEVNISTNQWLEEFETLLLEIEDNIEINPDISIESCKSLLESVAKNILSRLDPEYNFKPRGRAVEFDKLLKDAKDKLLCRINNIDDEFIKELTDAINISALNPIANSISKIRNETGDICHGRILPKKHRNSIHLAITIKSFTDTFASHLLYLLLLIDLSYQEELKYDDNPDFNNFLDESIRLPGIVKYSKALFDQDFVSYEEELSDYQSDVDPE